MPDKMQTFMQMVMKEAQRNSFVKLLDSWGITDDEYKEIESWFKTQGIKL